MLMSRPSNSFISFHFHLICAQGRTALNRAVLKKIDIKYGKKIKYVTNKSIPDYTIIAAYVRAFKYKGKYIIQTYVFIIIQHQVEFVERGGY